MNDITSELLQVGHPASTINDKRGCVQSRCVAYNLNISLAQYSHCKRYVGHVKRGLAVVCHQHIYPCVKNIALKLKNEQPRFLISSCYMLCVMVF